MHVKTNRLSDRHDEEATWTHSLWDSGAEFQETSFDLLPADDAAAGVLHGSALEQCFLYALEAGKRMGRDFEAPRKLKMMMIDAGFEEVVEKQILAAVNSWPLDPKDKMIGNWVCLNGLKAAESLGKVMMMGGLLEEDAPALIQNIRQDLTNANMRVYQPRKYMSSAVCLEPPQTSNADKNLQIMWCMGGNRWDKVEIKSISGICINVLLGKA